MDTEKKVYFYEILDINLNILLSENIIVVNEFKRKRQFQNTVCALNCLLRVLLFYQYDQGQISFCFLFL